MSQEALLQRVDPTDLSTVQDWVDAATPALRNRLVKRCGADVPVHVDRAEDRRLEDVLGRVGVTACSFHVEPSNLRGLVLLDAGLVRAVVGRFLGDGNEVPEPERPLTRLDLRFATHLGQDVLRSLQEAIPLQPSPQLRPHPMSTNPRTVQQLPMTRHVIEVQCTLGSDAAPLGHVWVVLPPQGAGVLWPRRGPVSNVRQHPAAGLGRVLPLPVTVVAELARKRLPLSHVRKLSVGDTIDLGGLGDVSVRVGDRRMFVAEPGEVDNVRCARVKRRTS
jgi:flagellar motor switch protein FliM